MADEKPSIQIDSDWKKQAQEEKRRLAEQEEHRRQQAAASAAAPAAPIDAAAGMGSATAAPRGSSASSANRELPPASFPALIQSIVTQALYYLGELAPRGGEPVVNLDMAKHHIDTLAVLEEKTQNNLSEDEKRTLDAALYEARMRYVSVASQYIS
jgi:hypothetical protein